MPIHAPTLPPRPLQGQGLPPALVLARFEVRRILRQRLGRFFGFAFGLVLLVELALVYFKPMAGMGEQLLPQGAAFQAGLLGKVLLFLLWLQVGQVGGGLVARDTLYRIRPLIYAHPVRPLDYLLGKGLVAVGLPFLILLPFILLPWGVSLLSAGLQGPVWPAAPLYLIPAALLVALLMGSLTLGASSLASTPGAGFAWALGVVLGCGVLGTLLSGLLGNPSWFAVSPMALAQAWPRLLCGAPGDLGWVAAGLGTLVHLGLWLGVAILRTRPGEAMS